MTSCTSLLFSPCSACHTLNRIKSFPGCNLACAFVEHCSIVSSLFQDDFKTCGSMPHEHLQVHLHHIVRRLPAQPQLPQGPLGMIFLTGEGQVDVCLLVNPYDTIDNVKAEIHQLWTLGLQQRQVNLRFSTQGPQRRSVRRQIQVLPNMYLVGHLLQAQFGGPHAPVIEPGWRIDCVVTVSPPRRFKISYKRPVFHDHYDNNDNKRPRSNGI